MTDSAPLKLRPYGFINMFIIIIIIIIIHTYDPEGLKKLLEKYKYNHHHYYYYYYLSANNLRVQVRQAGGGRLNQSKQLTGRRDGSMVKKVIQ